MVGDSRSKSPEELLRERKERLEKVYMNKKPDRVPFNPYLSTAWVGKYVGVTVAEMCFNYDVMYKASVKLVTDFNVDGVDSSPLFLPALDLALMVIALADYPDMGNSMSLLTGPMHDILKDRYSKWPGRELPINAEPQFLGAEVMYVDEYRKLIEKPVEFLNEVVIPRVFQAISKPNSPQAYAAWISVGNELQKYSEVMMKVGFESWRLGWPSLGFGGFGIRPLDYISDHLRHPTNITLDLYRRPDDVLAAVDVITELAIKVLKATILPAIDMARKFLQTSVVTVGFPLHLNSMLSPKMYQKFYWPSLKKILIETINMGAIPFVFFEGDHTPHLETILELPKGKIYGMFERADLRVVRKVLGDHIVIGGGISPTVLAFAPKEKVYEEVCKLLNDVKEPGGFIFTGSGAPLPPEAKIENIWAAVEAVKKCGVYE
ncbi:MAG: uroporphyrinogen decarboxylase family protein [Ignisphaera sp.]|uniref:Uroporphyrinogen decarboxylase (URO-D) domain-containing protein n=1 Tax=Ignisphaera aggregans TaxID=334771 RepID=A0A7C4NLF4_9CREN